VDRGRLLQQNGVTVRTITFDPATGDYEVTQNAPILHPSGGDENNLVFVLTVTVTDADGDTAHGTITLTYNDDRRKLIMTRMHSPLVRRAQMVTSLPRRYDQRRRGH
jgi:hypothetical protein